jgi:DNA-binding transcriptional LysR family regulator
MLPGIVRSFSEKFPNIDISLEIRNTDEIVNMILNNHIDLGLIEGEVGNDEILKCDFYTDELVFIAPLNHQWKDKKILNKNDLADEKLILREQGSETRMIGERALCENDIKYKSYMEIGHNEAIKKLVKNGFGVSFISKLCIEDKDKKDFIIRRMEGLNAKRKFWLIYHKDKFMSKLLKTFMDYVQK